jgi:hypothetical protein
MRERKPHSRIEVSEHLITPEGEVTAEGYAVAALYEEPTKDQRLLTEVADEPVPGPFAVPNVNA